MLLECMWMLLEWPQSCGSSTGRWIVGYRTKQPSGFK
ncbi:hypothetical protein P4O66_022174 [Electrophorus voltai]|uniref:Uncharacterized protein n=1 Tax=Electrophorus voltai TaxID=2609070 RepID=A0AAD8YPS2_9TELE|nr:hypothetical protein P4O66_022174 [Electrophorus voltai]